MNLRALSKTLIFLLVFLLVSVSLVKAEESTILESYREYYYSYRETLEDFKLTREEYLKWKTLASRDKAMAEGQNLLAKIAEVLSSYFSLLKASAESQSEFNPEGKSLALSFLDGQLDFLLRFKGEILATTSPSELEEKSLELEADYKGGEIEADFVKSALKLAELGEATSEVENLSLEVKRMVEGDEGYPQRDRILGDWVFKISGKLELSRNSQNELWQKLTSFPSAKEYEQKKLIEDISEGYIAAQGLVIEVTDHLLEIVRKPRYE